MDNELRDFAATVFNQLSDIDKNTREALKLSKEAAHDTREALRLSKANALEIVSIKRHVFGPGDPPSPGGAFATNLEGRVSESESEISAVRGDIIALDAKIDARTKAQNEKIDKVVAETSAQTTTLNAQTKTLNTINKAVTGLFGSPYVVWSARAAAAIFLYWAHAHGYISTNMSPLTAPATHETARQP